jgi:predicted nucleic acid-binding protein
MQRTPTNDLKTAEILYGISALPAGRRRTALAAAATAMFAEDFAGRILPFEARAAARYPNIVLARRQAGNSIEKFDVLIAATTLGGRRQHRHARCRRVCRLRPTRAAPAT